MTNSLIAVHGATGTQGMPVVRHLVKFGHRVRAISRHSQGLPPGVEATPADLLDTDALVTAYTGVRAVVLQLPLVFDATAIAQAESVLAALRKAEVPRVVFNTGGSVSEDPVGVPFVDARALLHAQLPEIVPAVSLVAPAAVYCDNLAGPWSAPLVAAGEAVYPLPAEAPIPWVAADDVAAAIVEQVGTDAPAPVRLIAGPEDLTGPQVAAELGAALDHPVAWRTISPTEYESLIRPHLGGSAAAGIAATYESAPAAPNPYFIRRGQTTLRQWATRQNWR